ncbi:MAG: pyruvate formate lyase activating enzyme [Candidatus Saganbacteria bacterium]|uniref:Pyruvate formate lyase activating enzyme n=1 Tax=Candidatus Saganbacteria bacterium TaxID=2575572 RepID=A0A833P320_UNCSA|nr:MAG: pyruvate formate lyase activating enzyme [Candidatus Saganbacteria bacterium]
MKEALFYEKLSNNNVRCELCPRNCQIPPEGVGYCGVRINKGGTLYTLIYGVVSSIANDPIEKKPLFHFHPGTRVLSLGTYGCNMRCGHCQNWQIAHVFYANQKIDAQIISPEQLIALAKKENTAGIAWTYNEPVIWFEYALDGAKLAKQAGLYTVWVTNGYINIPPLDMISPYLDAFRVDIKGFTKESYLKLAKVPDFEPILKAAVHAKKNLKMHVECITNVVPTINDDEPQLRAIAKWIKNDLGADTPWHVTRFFPHLDFSYLDPTPIETLLKARNIGIEEGLQYVYLGNV